MAMLERQQANHLMQPQRKLVNMRIDAGGVYARRILERIVGEERAWNTHSLHTPITTYPMTARTTPPFRADHVGSFLRPPYLLEARDQYFNKATIKAAQLREVEDRAITEIVKFQEDVGLQAITDGEFRRTYFHIDFLEQLGGVQDRHPGDGETARRHRRTRAAGDPRDGKVQHTKDIQRRRLRVPDVAGDARAAHAEGDDPVADDAALPRRARAASARSRTRNSSPCSTTTSPRAYGDELQTLYDAGCRYVQMDDTNLAYLCDEKMREAARAARR